jgi:hypothetical protein
MQQHTAVIGLPCDFFFNPISMSRSVAGGLTNPALLAIVSALAFSVSAHAGTTIAFTQNDYYWPFLHAATPQQQQIYQAAENPFNHNVGAFGPGAATASLDLSFTDNSITSTGSAGGHVGSVGRLMAFADSSEFYDLSITVTDQPVSFTLTASISSDYDGRSLISLSGPNVNVEYDTFSGVSPQSGTTTGILSPGTYTFEQLDAFPSDGHFGGGTTSSSAQLQISAVPEPSAWVMFVVGGGLVCCFTRHSIRGAALRVF